MLKVERLRFDDLSDDEKEMQPDNGSGKDYANYLKVTHDGKVLSIQSDAMEPEDCSFSRDLKWIEGVLKACYELGVSDGVINHG
jgi:hypothetical protein